MSVAPFLVGLIAGGAQYAAVKYQLQGREDVVFYSVDQIKESFRGPDAQKPTAASERYVPLRSREHEYYTYIREGWNARVFGFRDAVVGFFQTK